MDNKSIIELYFQRNENAIALTREKYKKLLTKIAGNLLNQREDIEECISTVLLSVWNRIPPDSPDDFRAYICKITKRAAINMLRYNTAEKRNSKLTVSLSELEECLPSNNSSSYNSTEELTECINRFLEKQKEIDRKIFVRRYWYDESVTQIAQFFGINEKTVSVKLFRTRQKLREYLIKGGFIH